MFELNRQELKVYIDGHFNIMVEMSARCNAYQQICDIWNKESNLCSDKQIFINKTIRLIESKRDAIRQSAYGSKSIESVLQIIDVFLWDIRYLKWIQTGIRMLIHEQ